MSPLSNLPGPWRWEERNGKWWRIHDRLRIEDGPHDEPGEEPITRYQMEMMVDPTVIPSLNAWLAAGKGIAIYQNKDLSHPEVGHKRFASYGTPEAQFEDEPPEQMPDFPGEINWRYQLFGTYRGEPLEIT